MKAVLVEDEYMLQKSFVRLSSSIEGFELAGIFDNAEDAMEYINDNETDAAFIDICLPGMDGFQLAKIIRNYRPGMGLVFVTGSQMEKADCGRYGVDDILLKPYSHEMLEETVNGLKKRENNNS